MIIFLSYLLKVGACIAAFYLTYKVTLSKETFFNLNRLLLLFSIVLSIILPIWTITIIKEIIITQVPQLYNFIGDDPDISGQIYQNSKNAGLLWADMLPFIGVGLYILGAFFFLIKKIFGFIQISGIMRNSLKEFSEDGRLYIFNKPIIPFSWFGNIILSEEDYLKNKEIIIEHEKAHIRLGHNYDLIFINLITVFQWFNPFVWLLRDELVSVHEFQADRRVINKGIDAKKYQYLLISKGTAHCFSLPVVNHLCSGNFKQRIMMMLKKRSNPQNAIKALLLIPLVTVAIGAFAKTEYVETSSEVNTYEDINIPAPVQNLQKQEGFIYFVDGKELSEEVVKKMDLSEFVSYKIYKREEAIEKFGEKAKNGAVEIMTMAGRNPATEYSKQHKDALVNSGIKNISIQRSKSESKSKPQELSKFLILVETKEDGIKLTGIQGCAFVELTFNLGDEKSQPVDQFGMSSLDRDKSLKDNKLADFLFVVKRTKSGLILEGIEGTSWKELSFNTTDNKCRQLIDQNGMKNISSSEYNSEIRLLIKINDAGNFMVNNEVINEINNLEYAIKYEIVKMKAISNGPIIVTLQTSINTPKESVNKVQDILRKENITKINYN